MICFSILKDKAGTIILCIHTHTHTHTHTYIHTHTHTHKHVYSILSTPYCAPSVSKYICWTPIALPADGIVAQTHKNTHTHIYWHTHTHTACSDRAHTGLGPGPSGGLVGGTRPPQWLMFPIQSQIDYHVACFLQSRWPPTHHPHLISITMGLHGVESWPHPPLYPLHHSLSPSLHLLSSFLSSPSLFSCDYSGLPFSQGPPFLFFSPLLFHVFIHAVLDVFQSLPPFLFLHHHYPSLKFPLVAPISLVSSCVFPPLCHLSFIFSLEQSGVIYGLQWLFHACSKLPSTPNSHVSQHS